MKGQRKPALAQELVLRGPRTDRRPCARQRSMDLLVRHRAAAENVDQEVWQFVSLRAWRCIFLLLLFPLQRFSSPTLPVFVAQCTCGRTAEPGPINPCPPAVRRILAKCWLLPVSPCKARPHSAVAPRGSRWTPRRKTTWTTLLLALCLT